MYLNCPTHDITFSILFFSPDYPDAIITNGVLVVMYIFYNLFLACIKTAHIFNSGNSVLCPKASTSSHSPTEKKDLLLAYYEADVSIHVPPTFFYKLEFSTHYFLITPITIRGLMKKW